MCPSARHVLLHVGMHQHKRTTRQIKILSPQKTDLQNYAVVTSCQPFQNSHLLDFLIFGIQELLMHHFISGIYLHII